MAGRRWWWASQSKNFRTAIPDGTLWSCDLQRPDGSLSKRRDRRFLQAMQRGDGVLHYADGYLRAVSVVRAPWTASSRPVGYPKVRQGDNDEGWLVRVEPLATELAVPFNLLDPLVGAGVDRPFGRDARPAQKYISRVEADEARNVIELIKDYTHVDLEDVAVELDVDQGDPLPTDAAVQGTKRLEQRALRDRLLRFPGGPTCILCGQSMPREFLVAAHVLPRRMLSDDERLMFEDVAVLMCLLGCDALYERGLVSVRDGVVTARDEVPEALSAAVRARAGTAVQSRSAKQAALFAEHHLLHHGGLMQDHQARHAIGSRRRAAGASNVDEEDGNTGRD